MRLSKLRVCLVGGPDVDARLELMHELANSFDVCAVGTEPALAESFAREGLRYRSYTMSRRVTPLLDLYAVWQLVRIFHAEQPAIVHTFDTKPAVWGRVGARLARVPVVIGTLPGLGSLYSTPDWRGRLARLAYQPLQTLACRVADVTIFQNEDDLHEFRRRRVVTRDGSTVIRGSGIRTDLFAPGHADAAPLPRSELGLPDSGLVVLMVSRLLRSKGVLEFAAAARAVRSEDSSVNFLLVGAADSGSLDKLTAAELEEVRRSVTWAGHRNDVKNVLAAADVFVFPSYYREGIPRVLLEAASMGLPLVAANVAGSRDVVDDGVNGFLVPPRDVPAHTDAVLRLVRAPELRRRFGASSRSRAMSHFDSSLVAANTASLYRTLLEGKQLA
jgi:glycosyltransferase involved in cell wall biosynthesis